MLLFPFEQRGNVIDTLPLAYVSFWHRMARPGLHCIWTLEVGDRDGAMKGMCTIYIVHACAVAT